jgi:Ca2+-transporting ATPase
MIDSHSSASPLHGLSEAEAQTRLKAEGYNELPRSEQRTALWIAAEVLREPMLALLLGAGVIYLALGELRDSIVLIAFAMTSILITVVQETRTERVLEALRDLTSPRALVIRDGRTKRIAGRDVVRGDIVVLSEGDRVPADAALVQCRDLQTDESLLTGESLPVRKIANDGDDFARDVRPGGDDLPFVFSGSLVVRGTGIGKVIATGPASEIGKIGQSLTRFEAEPPRLKVQTRRLVQLFSIIAGLVSAGAVLLYGFMRGDWLDAVLAGISLGMSMLPEEFPVVLMVFMAMGAWRISRARVLTRRAAAIEALGSATVLCTDKTGTLTKNRMTIVELRLRNGVAYRIDDTGAGIPEDFGTLIEFGILASAIEPFDPMERAFHDLGQKIARRSGSDRRLVRTYGLRPDLLAMTQVWNADDRPDATVIATKGAPEAVAELCRLSSADFAPVRHAINLMAEEGLRVLAVARGSFAGEVLPDSQQGFDFEFLGLIGLEDPLRESVPDAIRQCRSAGIKVIMITGDYPVTAQVIARQIGLESREVLTGNGMAHLNDKELSAHLRNTAVFARIMPEQKLRIVNTLKANNEIVAMTGDGVNDAPSLKAAHIGIAMGGRGTDVAREASAIVLLDDDFGSVVKAIRLGRRIYDNLRKALGFIFSVHVPIAGLALLPLPLGLPPILGPMHIAFLEMVIDPVCSLAFEAEEEEKDIMNRPPRNPDEPLFSWPLIAWSLLQGALVFGLVSLIFMTTSLRGMPENEVRALTFFSLTLSIISLILVNRSFSASVITALRRPNLALGYVLAIVAAILGSTLFWPFASELFRFGPLHADDLGLTFGAGFFVLVILELLKPFWRTKFSA